MTASFTMHKLQNHEVLVKGTDILGVTDETVLDSGQFDRGLAHAKRKAAVQEFDEAGDEFLAPLNDALDKLKAALHEEDVEQFVFDEGVEAVAGKRAHTEPLEADTKVLQILEAGDFDTLLWVKGSLKIAG